MLPPLAPIPVFTSDLACDLACDLTCDLSCDLSCQGFLRTAWHARMRAHELVCVPCMRACAAVRVHDLRGCGQASPPLGCGQATPF
eukprot:354185-Chlamydomonas_euryale.AAC.4